jgi:hypothetical protein
MSPAPNMDDPDIVFSGVAKQVSAQAATFSKKDDG